MWSLHQRASKYQSLPSAILGITYPILAYWTDEAIGWFGNWVESKLSERTKQNKPRYKLENLLGVSNYAKWKTGSSFSV